MVKWVVELEPGIYLADTDGDPGRTLVAENAMSFTSHPRARRALLNARGVRPFQYARVTLAPLIEDEVTRELPMSIGTCINCGSHAINHHMHGRDGTLKDLCDVCFWRIRADSMQAIIDEQLRTITALTDGVEAYGLPQETTPVIRFIAAMEARIEGQANKIAILITALSPLAECNLPPDNYSHHGVTAHFSTKQILAAKDAIKKLENK